MQWQYDLNLKILRGKWNNKITKMVIRIISAKFCCKFPWKFDKQIITCFWQCHQQIRVPELPRILLTQFWD